MDIIQWTRQCLADCPDPATMTAEARQEFADRLKGISDSLADLHDIAVQARNKAFREGRPADARRIIERDLELWSVRVEASRLRLAMLEL